MSNENKDKVGEPVVQPLTLTSKLFAIMSEFPQMKKTKLNKFGNFKYLSHDEVTKEVRKLFVKHRIMAYPSVTEMSRDNSLTRVIGHVEIVNVDNEQDRRVIGVAGMCVLDNDKAYGAALSYALKYAYLKLFNIESGEMDTDDNDGNDKVYDPSGMGDYLADMFERLKYTPERIKKVWEENEKSWDVLESRAKAAARKQAAEKNKKAGKK